MPDPQQIPWDWLSAQQRLGQGRISDPSQDRLSASDTPDWWWQQQRYRERQTPGLIERPEHVYPSVNVDALRGLSTKMK